MATHQASWQVPNKREWKYQDGSHWAPLRTRPRVPGKGLFKRQSHPSMTKTGLLATREKLFACLFKGLYMQKSLSVSLHLFPNYTGPEPWTAVTANHTCTPMDGRHFRCRARLRSSSRPGIVLMMSVGGLGLARGGTGANSRVRAPMAGPSSPSAELQRRAGPSAPVKLSWAESVLLWAVMEMRGGAWLPVGMGGGAFRKLKAANRDAGWRWLPVIPTRPHPRGTKDPTAKDHFPSNPTRREKLSMPLAAQAKRRHTYRSRASLRQRQGQQGGVGSRHLESSRPGWPGGSCGSACGNSRAGPGRPRPGTQAPQTRTRTRPPAAG